MTTAKPHPPRQAAQGAALPPPPLPLLDVSVGVDAIGRLQQAGVVLGVSPESIQRAWHQASALGLPISDPTTIFLVVSGRLDDIANRLPAEIRAAAADAADGLHAATTRHAAAAGEMLAAARGKAATEAAAAIETAIAGRLRAANRMSAAVMALVVVASIGLGSIAGWSGGKASGRSEMSAAIASIGGAAARDDAAVVGRLLTYNNFNALLKRWCGSGQQVYRESGWQCTLPVWISPRPAPPAGARSSSDVLGYALDEAVTVLSEPHVAGALGLILGILLAIGAAMAGTKLNLVPGSRRQG